MIAVVVLGGALLCAAIVKLIALVNRPPDRNFVSTQWLEDYIRGRRDS
jgi:hypothetical protein